MSSAKADADVQAGVPVSESIAAALAGTALSAGAIFGAKAANLPRVFWSSDACPAADLTCGTVPLAPLLAVAVVAAVWVFGFSTGGVR